MRFMVLLTEPGHFDKWDALDETTRERVVGDFQAFAAAVEARGSLVAGEGLDRTETARTVRAAGPGEHACGRRPVRRDHRAAGRVLRHRRARHRRRPCELVGLLPREYSLEVRPVVDVDLS